MSRATEPIAPVQPQAQCWHRAGQGPSVTAFCRYRDSAAAASAHFGTSPPESPGGLRQKQIHMETSCSKEGLESYSGVSESWCCLTAGRGPTQHHQCHHMRWWWLQWLCPEPHSTHSPARALGPLSGHCHPSPAEHRVVCPGCFSSSFETFQLPQPHLCLSEGAGALHLQQWHRLSPVPFSGHCRNST